MVFRVNEHRDPLTIRWFGRSRFRQNTALIGATLLFCLAGVGAEADALFYNYNGPSGSPEPQNGGTWTHDDDDRFWIERNNNGSFDTNNTWFSSVDDAYFRSTGGGSIAIEIGDALVMRDIVVEQGDFVFNDEFGSDDSIDADNLSVLANGDLTIDTNVEIDETAEVLGALTIAAGRTLTIPTSYDGDPNAVTVNAGGSLTLNGTITGSVTVDGTGSLALGSQSFISETLTFNGSTFNGGGHIGRLTVNDGSNVTFGGANAEIDRQIYNDGNLTLGEGQYEGALTNDGFLTVTDSLDFGAESDPVVRDGRNQTGATILATGGDQTLTFTGDFVNDAWLRGGGAGNSLTISANQIRLQSNTQITGNVTLIGAINNNIVLDMAHVPTLGGEFINTVAGVATVTQDVDGNNQAFINNGSVQVTGGDLTGLASFDNNTTLQVTEGNTLGATTIRHNTGSLTSRGTLEGEVIASSTASIQGAVIGSYEVAGGTTTVTGALDLSASDDGGLIEIGDGGTLTIADTMRVTTASLENDGVLNLGTTISGAADAVIDGDVINTGEINGEGRITGDLTFTGDADTDLTGTLLIVNGALVNDLDDPALFSDYVGISYGELSNIATLTIDEAATGNVTNETDATMTVNAAIAGNLTSRGQTALNGNVNGRLQVLNGVTTVGANTAGGPVLVGGATTPQLTIGADGVLLVSGGSLTSSGTVQAEGQIRVSQAVTLTTPRLIIAGNNDSRIRGTVAGDIEVDSAGVLELDGAIVTGQVTNEGRLNGSSVAGRANNLQGGLENSGTVDLTSEDQPVTITGSLENESTGSADIIGNVVAGAGQAGNVTNAGDLDLTGDVAGTVTNSNLLTLDGDASSLVNNLGGVATVTGDIGVAGSPATFDVVNRGELDYDGVIANSLRNLNTATVDGTVGGNAVNRGTLNLAADVVGEIRNNGSAAVLNITDNIQVTDLRNTGTVTVNAGQKLDLTSGELTNVSGGVLNVEGTIETSAASGALGVQNDAGGRVNVVSGGTLSGNLNNDGVAEVAGTVTGDVVNAATGELNLLGTDTVPGTVAGTLTNTGEVLVDGGATATVTGGITNQNDLEVRGALTSDVDNLAGGTLEIAGGTVTGSVNNEADAEIISSGYIVGDVTNSGTYTVDLFSSVDGDFINDELLTQSSENSYLNVDGTLTNNGTISTGEFAEMTINAGNYVNNGTTIGAINFDGNVDNVSQMVYTGDTDIGGNLVNQDNGIVRVWATVTGDGENQVVNDGIFEIARGGALVDVDRVTNRDRFTIAAGSRLVANQIVNAAGTLTNAGRIEGNVVNREGAELVSTRAIIGDVSNAGEASLSGRVQGALHTTTSGETTVADDLLVTGQVRNDGSLVIAAGADLEATQTILNADGGTLTANGSITGDVQNNGTAQILGGLTGNLTNAGDATLSGEISGALVNNGADATTVLRIGDSLEAGSVDNQSGQMFVDEGTSLTVANSFLNRGDGVLTLAGTVNLGAGQPLLNTSSGGLNMLAGSTLNGDLHNEGTAALAGTINGTLENRDDATGAGRITGNLVNEGATFETSGNLVVEGEVINRRAPLDGEDVQPGEPQRGPGDPALLRVAADTVLTAERGVSNDRYSRVEVDGTLNGRVSNDGDFNLTNRLNGTLDNRGRAALEGVISRNLNFRDGSIALTGDLTVGGTFNAFRDFTVASGRTLTADLYNNRAERTLTVNGRMAGAVANFGTIEAGDGASIANLTNTGTVNVGTALDIRGSLKNNGRVDMADGTVGDVLTVNGNVSGRGTYALDLDLAGNGGAGAADRVVVRDGAVTGSILLSFDAGDIDSPSDESRRILVFDVDSSQGSANNFTISAEGLPDTSERIVYALVRDEDNGNIYVSDAINPSLGALAGNLALTQSLIGSVVNRPTSPFVPGLATDAGDQKCGYGAWARAVAGHATATGRSTSGDQSADSEIEANYHGLQFGGDLACFENSFHGWNVAVGVLGGVNDGSTTQPVYINDTVGSGTGAGTGDLSSVNSGDFRQIYGGVYATATRDRLSLDLQLRRERTKFTIDNQPTGSNAGLQLRDPEFYSNATTLSGSVSYAYQLPRDGWMFVPTAGFAFSNLSADEITFTTDDTLQIQDSQNRVGFVGGTLSKTFINPEKNSAIYGFGTATVYKDFADDTKSVYTMLGADGSVIRTDELSSSNLGTYAELSLGANYLKVLDAGQAGKPRQFNASIRVDGRTGDVLDSYGVTAQVRFQF